MTARLDKYVRPTIRPALRVSGSTASTSADTARQALRLAHALMALDLMDVLQVHLNGGLLIDPQDLQTIQVLLASQARIARIQEQGSAEDSLEAAPLQLVYPDCAATRPEVTP